MHTDSLFHRLFQERPQTVFELAGLDVPADPAYRGDLTTQQRGQVEQLSADDLGALGEALLDFTQASDLDDWLQDQR